MGDKSTLICEPCGTKYKSLYDDDTDPKSYSNINVCRREAPITKYGVPSVSHAEKNSIWQIVYFKQFYNAIFASFIVANDVLLRIALVIL